MNNIDYLNLYQQKAHEALTLKAQGEALLAQAAHAQVDADHAQAMHKALSFGNGARNGSAPSAPAQAPQAQQQPQASNGVHCADCGLQITDSGDFTVAKKVASSTKKYGRVVCFKCEKAMKGG
jgi:hypothetical protein